MSKDLEPNLDFEPAVNCKYYDVCLVFGMCQEALVIRRETTYRKQGLTDSLAYQVQISICNHPQAIKAREETKQYLKGSS